MCNYLPIILMWYCWYGGQRFPVQRNTDLIYELIYTYNSIVDKEDQYLGAFKFWYPLLVFRCACIGTVIPVEELSVKCIKKVKERLRG